MKTDDRLLEANIRAFEAKSRGWKEYRLGRFVIFHNELFINSFSSFDEAARFAIKQFGRSCYLIREIRSENPKLSYSRFV